MKIATNVNGTRYLINGNVGYVLNGVFANPNPVCPAGLLAQEEEGRVFSYINDKLHQWSPQHQSFVAVPMKQYAEVFEYVNSQSNGDHNEDLVALEEEIRELRAERDQARADLKKFRDDLRNTLGVR